MGGHLEVLKWAREHNCPWDDMTCTCAVGGGESGGGGGGGGIGGGGGFSGGGIERLCLRIGGGGGGGISVGDMRRGERLEFGGVLHRL